VKVRVSQGDVIFSDPLLFDIELMAPAAAVPTSPLLTHSKVEEGLDFILSHLQPPLWPRTISTKTSEGRQILVDSKQTALAYFRASNYRDCRISAFHYWKPSLVSNFAEIRNEIAPNFIMIDLDKANFSTVRALKLSLTIILKNIKQQLAMTPTVLWSGNGYHIYIPINAMVLENIRQFNDIEDVSKEFLRFAESYLSSGKSDMQHNNTISLNNCLLRIPYSINSKNGEMVQLIERWDNVRPNINLLIGSFCAHLTDLRLRKQREREQARTQYQNYSNDDEPSTIQWIEFILGQGLEEHRKFLCMMILPQYLMNIRKLSSEESHDIIDRWLESCSMKLQNVSRWSPGLYEFLQSAGAIGHLKEEDGEVII
jgi:hypothetical protein